MKVHFIYVNKTKYSGSALKFTFYYLYYFQIPRFHSRLCFTLTVSDTQWVASCLLIEENASVFRWRERRAIQVSYRQFKLLRESSTFSQLRPQLSFAAFFFTLWMKKSFLVPANRIVEVYAEKIKAFSATNWIFTFCSSIWNSGQAQKTVILAITVRGFERGQPGPCSSCSGVNLSCEVRSIEVVWTGMVLLSTHLDFKLQGHYDQAWWRKVQSKMTLQSELRIWLNTTANGCNGTV